MRTNIVVYRYVRPDKDEPFYIGIGTIKRARDTKWGRSNYFKRICKLNGGNLEPEILEDELTWKQAVKKEIWWIALYGRENIGTGILCNLTDGGEGAYGRKQTLKSIEKAIETKKRNGNLQPMLGKTHTAEVRAIISETHKGCKRSQETRDKISAKGKGRKCTQEQKDRMSEGQLKRGPVSEATRQKLSEKMKNRDFRFSDEQKKQISEKLKGHSVSESARRKISEANKGRVITDEVKEKIRQKLIGRVIKGKEVINIITGEIYPSASAALKRSGFTFNKFFRRLAGTTKDELFTFKYI